VRYYLDGTVYQRLVEQHPETGTLRDWIAASKPELATSALARWEVAEQMAFADHARRIQIADALAGVRDCAITGRALEIGSFAVAALSPYAALHVGIAAADEEISVIVTYDADIAGAARLHGLDVVTPGRADLWYAS